MKNNKFSNIPPLVENDLTVQDPLDQSNIFNKFFASKSTVQDPNDPVPDLIRKEGVQSLNTLNTSPLEVEKIIRKKKHLFYQSVAFLGNSFILFQHQYLFHFPGYLITCLKLATFQTSGMLHT